MPVETKTLAVAFLVGIAHLIGGLGVLADPAALLVTPFASLHSIAQWLGYGHTLAGVIMIVAGLMAVAGSVQTGRMPHVFRMVLFAPQQGLLLMQLWSISVALAEGKYPDGYVPVGGAWFILTDQAWAWILAISHSVWLAAFIYGGTAKHGNSS